MEGPKLMPARIFQKPGFIPHGQGLGWHGWKILAVDFVDFVSKPWWYRMVIWYIYHIIYLIHQHFSLMSTPDEWTANSDFYGYWNGTHPFFNSRLGFIHPGLTSNPERLSPSLDVSIFLLPLYALSVIINISIIHQNPLLWGMSITNYYYTIFLIIH